MLIKIKAQLNDDELTSRSLADDLYQLAALAENFIAQRPRSNKTWNQLADTLDREGEPSQLYDDTLDSLTLHRCQSMEYFWPDSSRHGC